MQVNFIYNMISSFDDLVSHLNYLLSCFKYLSSFRDLIIPFERDIMST